MFAAVDLGSNSFRLHIGEHDGLQMHVIKTARNPIHLASGLDSQGYLIKEAQQRALHCLSEFKKILSSYPLKAVKVVGTNTLRIAKNAEEFLPAAEKALGYPIEIISGEEEGRLIYVGVANALLCPYETRLVSDIGGGSTEVVVGCGETIHKIKSFPIGTHKQTLSFFGKGLLTEDAFERATEKARAFFAKSAHLFDGIEWQNAYGSSGTMRTIAAVIEKNHIGNKTTSYDNLLVFKNYLISLGHVDQVKLIGLKSERVQVLVSGLTILLGLMSVFHISHLSVTTEGLRMGVLWELYAKYQQEDPKEQAVLQLADKYQANKIQSLYAARLASALYVQMQSEPAVAVRPFFWSAYLFDIGRYISQHNTELHSSYIVANSDLEAISNDQQLLMSRLLSDTKGALKTNGKSTNNDAWIKAIFALRTAVILCDTNIPLSPRNILIKFKSPDELRISFLCTPEELNLLKAIFKQEQQLLKDINVSLILKRKKMS